MTANLLSIKCQTEAFQTSQPSVTYKKRLVEGVIRFTLWRETWRKLWQEIRLRHQHQTNLYKSMFINAVLLNFFTLRYNGYKNMVLSVVLFKHWEKENSLSRFMPKSYFSTHMHIDLCLLKKFYQPVLVNANVSLICTWVQMPWIANDIL